MCRQTEREINPSPSVVTGQFNRYFKQRLRYPTWYKVVCLVPWGKNLHLHQPDTVLFGCWTIRHISQ